MQQNINARIYSLNMQVPRCAY